jgi:iron(II)-dependent oxidoreductase
MRKVRALLLWLACVAGGVQAQDMVEVPAGGFTMGSDEGPEDERPAHRVELARFRIDRLPVTHADFAAFLDVLGPRGTYAGQPYRRYDDEPFYSADRLALAANASNSGAAAAASSSAAADLLFYII